MMNNPGSTTIIYILPSNLFPLLKITKDSSSFSIPDQVWKKSNHPDHRLLSSDLPESILFYKAMRPGINPAILERSRVAEIISDEMRKQRMNWKTSETQQKY